MTDSKPVVLYGTRFCSYCIAARKLLEAEKIPFEDVGVDGDLAMRREIMARSGRHTVPQIWIGDYHVGGYMDLKSLAGSGELQNILVAALDNAPGDTI